MDICITPSLLHGDITVIPSKSQAHRLLICAAFADKPTTLICPDTNRDIQATADCLQALGANILRTEKEYRVTPVSTLPQSATLNCCESGSTLRFMLPIVGALGVDATFLMEGRLPYRPLSPLWEEMERMGCMLDRPTESSLRCRGKLLPGDYSIDGSVSSQFITGLLFALNLLPKKSQLSITGKIESRPYIALTKNALAQFGVASEQPGGQQFRSPGTLTVEGDWSNAAFWYAACQMGSKLNVKGLNVDSVQGDRAVISIAQKLQEGFITISAGDIPDLVPILSVIASYNHGAQFTEIERLRLKESDRVSSVCSMLQAFGVHTEATHSTMTVHPGTIKGGTVDACGDHRIAMSAAIAATVANSPVTILGAQCVSKSYPGFWAQYARLGGNYEQHLR